MMQRQFGHPRSESNIKLKHLLLSLFLCACAWAQVINSVSATATQALVRFTAPLSPACTIQVSENANLSPLEAEVDPSLFANANSEAGHLDPSSPPRGDSTRTTRIRHGETTLALPGLRQS